jgi:histidyl-tRNA synthetase
MIKSKPLSGFPEWLPQQRLIEEAFIAKIKSVYESYGFTPIETAAVETIDVLAEQGVTDKEIYSLRRLQAEDDEESKLGLHFDLTVPFSRYVCQNLAHLKFPFRRYQVQKVWRGERPQKGRFREFYQFDADLVARDELPLSSDAEILCMFYRAFKLLNIGDFKISVNNRKCVLGRLGSLGVADELHKSVLIVVDKLHKIGRDKVIAELIKLSLSQAQSEELIQFCSETKSLKELSSSNISNPLEKTGLQELEQIADLLPEQSLANFVFDPSLVRGLDYYTGLIFEVTLLAFPEQGSIGGGGRYENLLSRFSTQKLPGVGGSIGLSRIMDLVFNKSLATDILTKQLPQILVTVLSEGQRKECNRIAEIARSFFIPTEVYFRSVKLGKQIEYASDRNIPYAVFLDESTGKIQVKDLRSRVQVQIEDLNDWCKRFTVTGQ